MFVQSWSRRIVRDVTIHRLPLVFLADTTTTTTTSWPTITTTTNPSFPAAVALFSFTSRPFIWNTPSRRTLSTTSLESSSSFDIIDTGDTIIETMPEPPYTHEASTTLPPFDLTALGEQIARDEERRKAAGDLAQRIQVAYTAAKDAVDFNLSSEIQEERMQTMKALLLQDPTLVEANRKHRLGHLSYRVEDYARLSAFRHFLQTAQMWPVPSSSQEDDDNNNHESSSSAPTQVPVTDEEYLAGACMGLAQDLARYGLGRATVRDVASVQAAKTLVAQILDFLVQFDFRNGPLRRKYDGVKYALQALERLLYELAVTDSSGGGGGGDGTCAPDEPPAAKKARSNHHHPSPSEHFSPELLALKQRMDHRDELREKLIKKCRDGQKAAKQAIFALHRNDIPRATSLLEQCETCIRELYPIIEEEPPLRSGSFANMLEEYVEARLFAAWLQGETTADGKLLVPSDFDAVLELLPDEYLGGLCDLTGEIGRYAVQRGTARDANSVRLCLHSNQRILSAIQSMPVFPFGIGKKMDALRRSIEKLERILYELSLSEAAGGRPVQSEVENNEEKEE